MAKKSDKHGKHGKQGKKDKPPAAKRAATEEESAAGPRLETPARDASPQDEEQGV